MEAQNPQVTHPVPRALKNTGRFDSQSSKPQSAEQRETAETPVFDMYTYILYSSTMNTNAGPHMHCSSLLFSSLETFVLLVNQEVPLNDYHFYYFLFIWGTGIKFIFSFFKLT